MCNAWNHPRDCTCGWGGDGHLGRSSHGGPAFSVGRFSWGYGHENFCRPTRCKQCGSEVFFLRHNGGSVWLDALGWPWPKHLHSTDDDLATTRARRMVEKLRHAGTRADLGVILEAETSWVGPMGQIEVRAGNGAILRLP